MNKVEILGAKETLYVEHLDNGLDIYMVPNRNLKNYYITLNIKYGSVYTNYKFKGENYSDPKGTAHYMEHLKFNTPEGDAYDYFGKLGSSINAYTSNDVTCYEVFANSKFKENLSYLIKYVYTPYFNKELVNNERGIIAEEIKMYEDDPSTVLFHGLCQNIFINDEHRYLISGTTDDIKNIKLGTIENVFDAFYHPVNMFMIITGNFNPEEAVAIVSESMNNFAFSEYSEPVLKSINEPFKINSEYMEREMNVSKSKVVVGFKIPKSNFKSLKLSNLELKLYLSFIMRVNFGATSILNEEMKSNGIINKSIGTRLLDVDDYYVQCFFAETDYPDYFSKRIKEVFANLSINEENIKRKVKSAISGLVWLFDNIEAVNMEIQYDIINYGTVITDVYTIYKSLDENTANKIIAKLSKNLCSTNVIKPKKEKSAL